MIVQRLILKMWIGFYWLLHSGNSVLYFSYIAYLGVIVTILSSVNNMTFKLEVTDYGKAA